MIFVFGSNLAGRHGKGAAKYARDKLGAEYGVGEGLTGSCYALPTKDHELKVLPLEAISSNIDTFLSVAKERKDLTFKVTPIGCGLAGYKKKQIAGLFYQKTITDNVVFSKEWFETQK